MSAGDKAASTVRVGKVPFQIADISQATRTIIDAADRGTAMSIRLSNAYCVALASSDTKYAELMNDGGVNFPDGTPVSWAMRARARKPARPLQVRGPSLFLEVMKAGRKTGVRHFLLGTNDDTLTALNAELVRRIPGIFISGQYAPPYGPLDEQFVEKCLTQISPQNTDVLWVALGTPKQDFATAQLAPKLGIPCIGVGAAFDFVAGTTKEAPEILQNTGLEWLYRFAKEPRRLWRRYLFGNIQFIVATLVEARREAKGRL
jgi:N-acetylglucosaminyldiphosphoundecaprenol N-acetyl-beta-D-mannosaminyltransferase